MYNDSTVQRYIFFSYFVPYRTDKDENQENMKKLTIHNLFIINMLQKSYTVRPKKVIKKSTTY